MQQMAWSLTRPPHMLLQTCAGVTWVLGKLRAYMSVILGDEMGLGKTIQTAAFLQARGMKTPRLPPLPPLLGRSFSVSGPAYIAPAAPYLVAGWHDSCGCDGLQLARQRGLTTGPVAVVVPLSTFGSWERELAK